jgi:hypothetical protein
MTMDEEDLTVQNLYKANKVQQKRIKELEAHLREYGTHKNVCAYSQGLKGCSIEKCDCGLDEALKGE